MATLEQRLNDPEYRNWVKTVLCLQYVRDGLVSFAGVKSQDLHQKVLNQLQHYGNPSAKRLCPNISFNSRKTSITCCANCNGILTEILKYRNGNKSLNLTNTDPSKLLTEHWQVAKFFMNTGQGVTNADPNETDISGLLNFLEKCSEPAQYITVPSNVEQVRLLRNQIIHTSDMKITDAEFKKNIPVMLALLEDPGYLLNDSRAIAAATGIKQVTYTDFKITTVNEIAVLKDFVHEQTKLVSSEVDKLRGEVSDCSSQRKEDMKMQQEKLNDMEGKMEKVQIGIERLKDVMKSHTDQQDTLLHDVLSIEERVKTIKEDIESLYKDISFRVTELEKKQAVQQSISNTLKERIDSFERKQEKGSEQMQALRNETMEEIQGIKSSQEKYQHKTDIEIQRLKQEIPAQENCPTEEDKNRLVEYLKEGYREILMVPVSSRFQHLPVSEIFAPVILIKGDREENKLRNDTSRPDSKWTHKPKKESDSGKELQSYREILQDVEVHRPIFLLGEAGTGKTTFCKHLTDLWCKESTTFQFQDPEVLTRYRFVFQVSCRFAEENDTVFDMICKQLFDDVSLKRIAEYLLTHNPEECFIILDGLDEWKGSPVHSTGRRGDIQGLPGTKGVDKSLILITSRPWRFQALPTVPEKKNGIFELNGLKSPKMLTTVILKKMGDTDPEKSCNEFLWEIRRCSMLEMIQIPLIFQIVLNIWHENKTLHRSICQNYMSLINSFIERADHPQENWGRDERRLIEPLVYNIEYWKKKWCKAFDSLPECCQKFEPFEQFAGLIISLSQIAFDFLFYESESGIQQKLVFSWDDCKRYLSEKELRICLGIGIISKTQSHRGNWKVENYSFIHKTVQEFLAALWLAKSNGVNSESIRKHLTKSRFEFEIFIRFLCGFAPEAGAYLLCDLYKHDNLDFWEYEGLVLDCWAESQNCNDTTYTCFTLSTLHTSEFDEDDIRLLTSYFKESPTHTNTLEDIGFFLEEETDERLFECLFSLSLPVIRKIEITSYSRGTLNHFYQSVSSYATLESLNLRRFYNDNTSQDKLAEIDLHNHYKLEKLRLTNLSLKTILLPLEINTCLKQLTINNPEFDHYDEDPRLCLSHNGLIQFYHSLSCCVNLVYLYLDNITCSDDSHKGDLSVLDFQNLHKLEKLELRNLSAKTVLFPQKTESCLRVLRINTNPEDPLRVLKIITNEYPEDLSCHLYLSRTGMDQFYQALSGCCSLETIVLRNVCCDDIFGNHSSVMDLQKLHKLRDLDLRCLLVEIVLFPQETDSYLDSLTIHKLKIECGKSDGLPFLSQSQNCFRIDQFYQSISRCVNLRILKLNSISCSDDSCENLSLVLDLQELNKLQALELRSFLVKAVQFPQETGSCLNSLTIHELKLVHGGFEGLPVLSQNQSCFSISQLYQSISHCVNLRYLDVNTISCNDNSCCNVSILDLQNLHKLHDIKLQNLSLTTVLFPQKPNFHPRFLKLRQLQLTHGSIEELRGAQGSCISTPSIDNIVCADHDTGCKLLQDDASGDDNDASDDANDASDDANDASDDDNDVSGDDNDASGDDNDVSGDDNDVSGDDNDASDDANDASDDANDASDDDNDASGDDNDASDDANDASDDANDASGDDNDASGDANDASDDANDASDDANDAFVDDNDASGVDNH